MKIRNLAILAAAVLAAILLLAGCSSTPTQSPNPEWVDQLARKFAREPVGNPPQSIWRYEYNGQVVYYVPAQCCDMFSTLYDADGTEICAPNGGITGTGDGRCKDFMSQKTGEQLIWQDPRTR